MASLLQFEEKVHRKDLVRAESIPLLMPRLLCQVLEHMGFPEEPRLEMRVRCPLVMSVERVMTVPVSFHLRPQDQEEVPGQEAEDAHTDDIPAPEPEESSSTDVTFISSSIHHIGSYSRYSWPILFSTPFAGVHSCQLERDSWCDGCHLLTSSYAGSPGSEVSPVPLYASADHDALGSSS